MRLHFLQTTRQIDKQSPASIGAIANQLNYILRDLEATGKIQPRIESPIAKDSNWLDSFFARILRYKSIKSGNFNP